MLAAGLQTGLAALGAVGALGGISALLLLPRQQRNIAVSTAEAAVNAVNVAMARLEDELERATTDLSSAQEKLTTMGRRLEIGTEERERLEREVAALKRRILELEELVDARSVALEHLRQARLADLERRAIEATAGRVDDLERRTADVEDRAATAEAEAREQAERNDATEGHA